MCTMLRCSSLAIRWFATSRKRVLPYLGSDSRIFTKSGTFSFEQLISLDWVGHRCNKNTTCTNVEWSNSIRMRRQKRFVCFCFQIRFFIHRSVKTTHAWCAPTFMTIQGVDTQLETTHLFQFVPAGLFHADPLAATAQLCSRMRNQSLQLFLFPSLGILHPDKIASSLPWPPSGGLRAWYPNSRTTRQYRVPTDKLSFEISSCSTKVCANTVSQAKQVFQGIITFSGWKCPYVQAVNNQ